MSTVNIHLPRDRENGLRDWGEGGAGGGGGGGGGKKKRWIKTKTGLTEREGMGR